MSSTEATQSPRPANFLVTLLRRGAPAVASAPGELTDEVSDPTPMRAWRRIKRMTASAEPLPDDGLLVRAARYVAFMPLLYRIIAVTGALVVFLTGADGQGVAPVLVVAVLSVGLNLFGAIWLLRSAHARSARRGDQAARLLLLDVVFTVLVHLVVAGTVPSAVYAAAMTVAAKHLLGAVALLTLVLGLPYGLALAALEIPLLLVCTRLNSGSWDLAAAFAGTPTTLGVLLTAAGALVLIGLGTRLALAYGIRSGRLAERARQHRTLHDTVLQTLETLSLPRTGDAETQLTELRSIARAQAMELRQAINTAGEASGGGPAPLGEKLAALAAEMARDGLRAQLVVADLDADTLSEVRQLAIRDAVREALRNTMKHAGTDRVVVRVEERDGGIAVITRDHGSGFSTASRPVGYGISESIMARLAEVGGTARVDSKPGNGTRVTLWAPR